MSTSCPAMLFLLPHLEDHMGLEGLEVREVVHPALDSKVLATILMKMTRMARKMERAKARSEKS